MSKRLDAEVGVRVHQLIGTFAQQGLRPSAEDVFVAAGALVRRQPFSETHRAGPQRVTCLTVIGLAICPPVEWTFLGSEVPTGDGRLDLAWMAPDDAGDVASGSVLIDEIMVAGYAGQLEDNRTLAQIRRYLDFGASTYGSRFVGVRLLSLSAPRRSVLWRPGLPGAEGSPGRSKRPRSGSVLAVRWRTDGRPEELGRSHRGRVGGPQEGTARPPGRDQGDTPARPHPRARTGGGGGRA